MHHVLIILTLTFIQGHKDLNNENEKCSITSETVQALPITLAVKIVRRKVYIIVSQFDVLAPQSRSPVRLKLDKCLNCTKIAISRTVSKLLHSNVA